jgi:hypothetical protein
MPSLIGTEGGSLIFLPTYHPLSGRKKAYDNILLERNVATRLRPDRDDMSVEKTFIHLFVPVRDDMSVDCCKVCTYSISVRCRNG